MLKFDEICKEIGYDRYEQCPIKRVAIWAAYDKGRVEKFLDKSEALKFSKNIELIGYTNQEEWDAYWECRRALESKAQGIWYNKLKEEFSELPVDVFNLCYDKAYDEGHSSGYDEVYFEMISIAEFVKKVIKCLK